jgi:succinate dehydrogenase / fumarate reductase, cytochrome b subunit
MASRPLSPHLSIYRLGYTMTLSILHRITGLALTLGLVMLCCWLGALASGESAYTWMVTGVTGVLLRVALALWLVAFLYHLANGLRHLLWDAGVGLERSQARRSAWLVIACVLVASILLLYAFFAGGVAP